MFSISGGKKDFTPGDYHLAIKEPLVAINNGVSVYVDVSSMLPNGQTLAMRREWASRFPLNCMAIQLIPRDGSDETVHLTYKGDVSYTRDVLYLILVSDSPIPKGVEYEAAKFTTTIQLRDIEVIWKNYGK
jgi:hypothetical protein